MLRCRMVWLQRLCGELEGSNLGLVSKMQVYMLSCASILCYADVAVCCGVLWYPEVINQYAWHLCLHCMFALTNH